jgi:hypothetical protein
MEKSGRRVSLSGRITFGYVDNRLQTIRTGIGS